MSSPFPALTHISLSPCSLYYQVASPPPVHPDDSDPHKPISTIVSVISSPVNPVSPFLAHITYHSLLYIVSKYISNRSNVWNIPRTALPRLILYPLATRPLSQGKPEDPTVYTQGTESHLAMAWP